jgi:hypothetical protein
VSSVELARLACDYRTTSAPAEAERLRARFDRLVASMCEVLGASLSMRLGANDDAVWIVRALHVELTVDVGAPDATIARWWGEHVAEALALALAGGMPRPADAVRFADRAQYVARFAADLAEERAWSRWWYEPFASVRSLPPGAAVVEAIATAGCPAWRVLARLAAAGRLDRVVELLTPAQARRLYRRAAAGLPGAGAPTPAAAAAARSAWRSAGPVARLARGWDDDIAHRALQLLGRAAAAPAAGATPPAALAATVEALLVLAAWPESALRGLPPDAAVLLEALRPGSADQVLAALPVLREAAPPALRAGAPPPAGRSLAVASTDEPWLDTPVGGLLLLLRSLVTCGAGALEPTARLALMARLLGAAQAPAVAADAVARRLAGLDRASLPGDEDGGGAPVAALGPADPRARGRVLLAEIVPVEDAELLAVRDAEHDAWLALRPVGRTAAARKSVLAEMLARAGAATGERVEVLVLGPGLAAGAGGSAARAAVVAWTDPPEAAGLAPLTLRDPVTRLDRTLWIRAGSSLPDGHTAALGAFLARAKPVAGELAYLGHLDPDGAVAARAALKHFARRLPGFEWASAARLRDGFLAGPALLRLGERWEAELAPRPLELVLRISGVNRETVAVPWLGGLEIAIAPARE